MQVTKYEHAPKSEWHNWNWKSEGDQFLNGAFFTSSSGSISNSTSNAAFFTSSSKSSSFSSASDIRAKSSSLVPKLTANAGALKCKQGSAC